MLGYSQASSLICALTGYGRRRIPQLVATLQCGPWLTDDELSTLHVPLRPTWLHPWSVAESVNNAPTTLCHAFAIPHPLLAPCGELALLQSFCWFLPQRLPTSSTPRGKAFVPVAKLKAPSVAGKDLDSERICADASSVWLMHCCGGKGRAGTVLTCPRALPMTTASVGGWSGL
jgi:hypothetical protein